MAGVDDNVALVGDWSSPNCLGLETWFSTIFDDNNGVRPNHAHLEENKYDGYFRNTQADMMFQDIGKITNNDLYCDADKNIQGGLAERLAARAEFNAPRLNIESITNTGSQSPYLAIPPGLSPAALLESPSFLQNSMKNVASLHEQSIVGNEVSLQSDHSLQSENSEPARDIFIPSIEKSNGKSIAATDHLLHDVVGASVNSFSPIDGQQIEKGIEESGSSTFFDVTPSEDGYTWRKYGQKQVKGCEYPRSYYKCTHLDCPVKKEVERSQEGHITKIIYEGSHNHPPPQPSHRLVIGSPDTHNLQLHFPEQGRERSGDNSDSVWVNIQKGCSSRTLERRSDNIEVTSSAYLLPQNENPLQSSNTIDVSSAFSSNEDEDDRGTHESASLAYDGKGEEPESKRRKVEFQLHGIGLMGAIRTNGKPRVVVQTISDVDIIDDGYRWRKYGQKVVRGNPNPRSYYKCTNQGCDVRKHVERASHDVKSVITTYEGKHNHAVPLARKNSHHNSSAAVAAAEQIMRQTNAVTAQSQVYRPEPPQIRSNMPMFERSNPMDSFGVPGSSQLDTSPGFSFGTSTSRLATMHRDNGLRSNQGRMHVHQRLSQRPINDTGFMPNTFQNLPTDSSLYGL